MPGMQNIFFIENKLRINVKGPIASDSSFMISKKYNFDVLIGMYHDQVLAPFKALYSFDAINITLGLSYIRVSPDHGTGEDIMGKKIANPESLIEAIKFFNRIQNITTIIRENCFSYKFISA